MKQDLIHALRRSAKNPGFATVTILTLAVGIGANTAIYTIARHTLFAPLPYPDPEHTVVMGSTLEDKGWEFGSLSIPELLDQQERNSRLSDIAIFMLHRSMTLQSHGRSERLRTVWATSGYFEILGAAPALGRTFVPEEDQGLDAHPVVVLSHHMWRNRFGSDPSVIGTEVMLTERAYTIVGVMPPSFRDLREVSGTTTDIWIPLTMSTLFFGNDMMENRSTRKFRGLARLAEGVGLKEARRAADDVAGQLETEHPGTQAGRGVALVSLPEFYYGDLEGPLTTLQVAAAFLLVLCCVNVAMLLLVKARARRSELAVRAALGASRRRLVREFLVESVALSFVGGLLGVGFALAAIAFMERFGTLPLPAFVALEIDLEVLGATLGLVVLTGIVFGALPAIHGCRAEPLEAIREGTQRTTFSAKGFYPMLTAEVFLAILLLVGAGLTARSFYRFASVDLGFRTDDVYTFRLEVKGERYQSALYGEAMRPFAANLLGELQELSGVDHAVLWAPNMIGEASWHIDVTPGELDPSDSKNHLLAQRILISPGALEAMEIPVLAGREFRRTDWGLGEDLNGDDRYQPSETRDLVAVVSKTLAEKLWPGREALGRELFMYGASGHKATIVGIAADALNRGRLKDDTADGDLYLPYLQWPNSSLNIFIRSSLSKGAVTEAVRATVERVSPDLAPYDPATLDERLDAENAGPAFTAALMGFYATMATLLAGMGLFGVMTFCVRQRDSEFAVRMALGASPVEVMGLVLRQGMTPVALGLVAGILTALLLSHRIAGLLFSTSNTDTTTYVIAAATLLGVAACAAILPTLGAGRQDPMAVLRQE